VICYGTKADTLRFCYSVRRTINTCTFGKCTILARSSSLIRFASFIPAFPLPTNIIRSPGPKQQLNWNRILVSDSVAEYVDLILFSPFFIKYNPYRILPLIAKSIPEDNWQYLYSEWHREVPHKHTTKYRKLWRIQRREILKWILNPSFYSNECKNWDINSPPVLVYQIFVFYTWRWPARADML
jgi:hypothetical protein